jgi:hypothetical protein
MILTADDAMQGIVPDPVASFRHHQLAIEYIAQNCFKGCFLDKTYLSSFMKSTTGNHEQARLHFFDAVNKGGRCVVYFGHGHPDSLSDEGFLRACDTALFTNDSSLSIYFSFSCDNGDFLRKRSGQMCKAFLFTSRGGSAAYVAASVQTFASENERFAENIFSQIDSTGSRSIGKTVLNAKLSVNGYSGRYYHVLGDPAIKFIKSRMVSSTTFVDEQNGISCVTTIPPSITGQLKYHYKIVKRDSVTCLDGLSPKYIDDSLIASFDGISSDGRIVTTIPNATITPKTRYILYAWNDTGEFRLDTSLFFQAGIVEKNSITAPTSGFKFNRNILTISFPVCVKRTATASIALFTINGTQVKIVEVPLIRNNAVLEMQRTHLPQGNYIFRAAIEDVKMGGKICFVR